MQSIQISDDIAQQLNNFALQSHTSNSELVERLIKNYIEERKKFENLKSFFDTFQKDLSDYKFDREKANAR